MSNKFEPKKNELEEFLKESNAIEGVYSDEAFEDAWKAWKFLSNYDELDLLRVLECHHVLMSNLNKRIAGKIRKVSVRVGYHIMPRPDEIDQLLERLLQTYPKTEEEIKNWHVAFENIHPFEDGNGRTGRIVMNWQRIRNYLPLQIIHTGKEQYNYYDWFQ